MHLYSLCTHKSYTKTCLISNLLVSASSSTITISKVNEETARLCTVFSQNLFTTILAIIPISSTSFCVLSDAGGIAILNYKQNSLVSTIANFGRSGIRTITPVYGACDPQARVLLIGAIESQRLVYILGIDNEITGPIDCSQKDSIVYDLCSLDVGYANPVFCQIERTRGEDTRQVVFYEFDLGLNILKRNQSLDCHDAHLLIPLPEAFSGVVVCRTNRIEFLTPVSTRPVLFISFPGRAICGAVHQVKQDTFALIQAEDGRIYKLNFTRDPDTDPQVNLSMSYFNAADPSTSLHIFKAGFLYTASTTADHKLYQFISLGQDEPLIAFGQDDETKCTLEAISQEPEPENLEQTDAILNFNALTCSRLGSARTKLQNSLVVANGNSTRHINFAINVEELVSSPLPRAATEIFVTGNPSKHIIVCFEDDVLMLKVDETVSEVKDSGLVHGKTMHVEEMDGVLVQIHSKGIRQVGKSVKDWTAPLQIIACAANSSQILVALQDNSLVYFEFVNSALQKVSTQQLDSKVNIIALQQTPEGSARANYAVVCLDDTLRICTIDTELQLAGIQNLTAAATSVLISKDCFMHVGLENGVYMQSKLGSESGNIVSTKSRVLGTKPVKVHSAWVSGEERSSSVVVISNQSWLTVPGYNFDMTPLSLDLTSVAKFSTEDAPQALAAVVGAELKIFSIDSTENHYNAADTTKLSSQPLRFIQAHGRLYTLLSNAIHVAGNELPFGDNITGLRLTNCRFESRNRDFLVVSALRNARYHQGFKQQCDEAMLLVYEYLDGEDGHGIKLVHATTINEPAHALVGFKGVLIAGVGAKVVTFDIGQKQLLKKRTLEVGTKIVELGFNKNRIFVGDSRRSVTVLVYDDEEGFTVVADDPISRAVSTMSILDMDTVVIGDRFGTISVLRLPKTASELSRDPLKLPLLAAKPKNLNGAYFKLELVANYYLGDVVTGIHLGIFAPGAFESLLWCGVQGNMGVLIPMSENDTKFFSSLENELRKQSNIIGRSHLAYRGYAAPPKNVVDGELCETFGRLDPDTKKTIATNLKSDPESIETRVTEFRVRCVTMH